ncbi:MULTISPECIES: Sec-independent protein translocase protein TatB [Caldimonas]|jgi:sec-independent protein translocase protein TatB|uniref:Sec-independent protein translocase protein TatB n=1 Tax=Caldimonas TaxID=196013 RepID=UPI00037073BB|nr:MULTISPECIES: Sec-independent protein translocase protein TatB [Caldimonas]MCX7659712.1 Sec-independent protein translocase protein TatB [Caldimonas manganoxidans]GIX22880.1 MAG: sec-independent protein translocase protein TatB [Caldimonas sp.]
MIDFGFDKLALIGAVALIVIGPERLPKVARTVGHLLGRAQRYVAEVKAEVNRSIELEELKKMKSQFEDAARNVEQTVTQEVQAVSSDFDKAWAEATGGLSSSSSTAWEPPPPVYKPPRKNWRLKRSAVPQWYRQRHGLRSKVQSGAARVARFRPPKVSSKARP